MSERFLKFIPSKEALHLARKHPNAFILLMFIANRARRISGDPDGYDIGQCHIGDHNEFGLTEKEYRTAKKILTERNHIKIIETCRTRKSKSRPSSDKKIENRENWATERATRTATYGTLVELCNSGIWDINPEDLNHLKGDRKDDRGATEGRPKGDEQEYKEGISNDIPKIDRPRTAKRPRSVDALSFDHESWSFTGIAEKDVADWKLMYPHIDIQVETLKAAQWFKNNQSKSKRSSYRKYLTGWFGRENERIENKKAYRSAAGGATQDRRTKDLSGNPVDSPHTGRF